MKRIFGILFLLFLIPPISKTAPQEYEFYLVWEENFPLTSISNLNFIDINNDGYLEILIDDPINDSFYVVNVFGEILWKIETAKLYSRFRFYDVDKDGNVEIFYIHLDFESERYSTFVTENGTIEVMNSNGDLLWKQEYKGLKHKYIDFPKFFFIDIDGDLKDEIIYGNIILDDDGSILHEFERDSFCVGVFENEKMILLKKWVDEKQLLLKMIDFEENTIWENLSKPLLTQLIDLNDSGSEELIIKDIDKIYEVDLKTFEKKWEIEFESDFSDDFGFLYVIKSIDLDNDSKNELLIIANKTYIYNENHELETVGLGVTYDKMYERSYPKFFDLNDDGSLEIVYIFPTYHVEDERMTSFDYHFDVYDSEANFMWGIDILYPAKIEIFDLNNDGFLEIIFDNFIKTPEARNYINILDFNGNLIRRYKPESISDLYLKDFDGDGDLDLLTIKWNEDDTSKVRLFNNTMKVGFLDSMESFGKLEEVSLQEEGFEQIYERDYEAIFAEIEKTWEEYTKTPFSLKSEWRKFKFFSRFPSLFFIAYKTEIKIFLGIVCLLGFLLAIFLTKLLRRKESNWQPLWSFKKVILYFIALITLYPLALIYFLYKIFKSSEDYKRALGFVRITKRQIFISIVIGLILFFTSWSLTVLFAFSGVKLPDTSGTEDLVKNYLLFAILLFVITAPIGEEMIYSGYLYPILRGRLGVKFGIFSTALLFSVMHLRPVLVPIFFVGALIKTYAYEKTHCIYVPMIIHFINNSIVVTLISLI